MHTSRELFKKLDDYQQDAVEWTIARNEAGLFFEQGTGKTWITGGVLERLARDDFQALLVVPLTNIDTTWAKFLAAHIRVPMYRSWEAFKEAPLPKILLVHYEALPKIIKKVRRLTWSIIVYDESHRLKARGTLQSRTAAKLAHSAERKLILSGTPIEKQPQDLWAQFRFLAPHVFGTMWKDFDLEFLEQSNIDLSKYHPKSLKFKMMLRALRIEKNRIKFREDRLPRFLEMIKPYCLRVTKSVLNLPSLSLRPTPVMLLGSQRRTYEALERDMITIVNRSRITAPLKVTQIGKLQQVCGGYVIDDDGDVHEVGKAKLRRLVSIIKRKRRPIVVFCRYRQEVWSIHDELVDLVDRVETLTGKTKKRDRAPIIEDFQAGKIDVLICQIRTGGVGIDLFRSCVGVFYSYTYSYIDFEQAVSRLHRRGQTKPVDIFLLYAAGTIDEDIYEAIVKKRKVTERVLESLKSKGDRYVRQDQARVQVRRRQPGQGPRHSARERPRAAA